MCASVCGHACMPACVNVCVCMCAYVHAFVCVCVCCPRLGAAGIAAAAAAAVAPGAPLLALQLQVPAKRDAMHTPQLTCTHPSGKSESTVLGYWHVSHNEAGEPSCRVSLQGGFDDMPHMWVHESIPITTTRVARARQGSSCCSSCCSSCPWGAAAGIAAAGACKERCHAHTPAHMHTPIWQK